MSKEVKRWKDLRAMAEKATPGPWVPFCKPSVQAVFGPNGVQPDSAGTIVNWPGFDSSDATKAKRKANARFIAAANPACILKLLAERDALLAERDALAEKARRFGFVEKAMEALACDEREGGIVTAASLILISSAHRMNAKRGVIDQEGVTFDDGQIGDWRVTIERIDAALQGEQP